VRTRGAKMIDHARQVDGKIAEIEGAVVIVARAITTRIPGDRVKMRTKLGKLLVPVGPIAADSVEENHQRSHARMIHRDPGGPKDNVRRPCRHRPLPHRNRETEL
jgi:hypothetical protein